MLIKYKNLCAIYLSIIFLLIGCRSEGLLSEGSTGSYQSKSLWKEDEAFIKTAQTIYENNKTKIEGEPNWDYAMTMGLTDRSLIVVAVFINNKVAYVMRVKRKGSEIFFGKNYEKNINSFLNTEIFEGLKSYV